jgi:hypothetical protein
MIAARVPLPLIAKTVGRSPSPASVRRYNSKRANWLKEVVGPAGIEPATLSLEG